MEHQPHIIPDDEVFASVPRTTLRDVLVQVETEYSGTLQRDTRSAFRMLERHLGVDLDKCLATPAAIREIFAGATPGTARVSKKRLANVRSCIARVLETFGHRRTWITKEIQPSAAWQALLKKPGSNHQVWGLSRLACYATVKGIEPCNVTSETLLGLHTALEAEEVCKQPRKLIKHTIAVWNMCAKDVADWPDIRLSSPFKSEPYMMPLDAFPDSFGKDIAAWADRMSNPDPFDLSAPARALRPATLESYHYMFRRLASALVRSEALPIERITGLAVFFDQQVFKAALRPFLRGDRITTDAYAHKMATQMIAVGRHYLGLEEADLAPFVQIAKRLRTSSDRKMGARNFERLKQFDEAAMVQRLLNFPEEELGRALALANPIRRTKGVERALAISLAIFTGLRAKNLRQIHLVENVQRRGGRVFVRFNAGETKNRERLELELPSNTINLLDLFLTKHRPLLPGSNGPYLFPGKSGGPRSYSAIRDAIGKALWDHAGIRISPHLYRHVVAKIAIERDPRLAQAVSRRLGHKSINTTYACYLGTEGPAASRAVNQLLSDITTGEVKSQ